jgi:hypothetical protein
MGKPPDQVDVLILGDHPCAHLAGIVLQRGGNLRVAQAKIPGEALPDRLVLINPELFNLDPALRPLKRQLQLVATYGLMFLSDTVGTSNGAPRKTIGAYVGSAKQIHKSITQSAKRAGVLSIAARRLQISGADEKGIDLLVNGSPMRARLLLLAGELPAAEQRILGLAAWAPEAICRYTFVQLRTAYDAGRHPMIPMSLNLRDTHHWAWLLPWRGSVQLAIEQPRQSVESQSPAELLQHWVEVLTRHGLLKAGLEKGSLDRARTMDLPLAGALAGEGVANRTLCIGPAGGFFSACAEDIYPNCWSALCAADVARSALKERHLQDALQAYRQRWGATLGDYLRGPQQNLRFLLPLVYRNATMASRLADAILMGKSVVR